MHTVGGSVPRRLGKGKKIDMNEHLNCPNCGAPVEEEVCSYCGTVIYDFATMDMDKPMYIKLRKDGKVIMFKVLLEELAFEYRDNPISYYADEQPIEVIRIPECQIRANFQVLNE